MRSQRRSIPIASNPPERLIPKSRVASTGLDDTVDRLETLPPSSSPRRHYRFRSSPAGP